MHNTAATGVPKSCQKDRLKACEINRLLAPSPNAPAMGGRTMKKLFGQSSDVLYKNVSVGKYFLFRNLALFRSEAAVYGIDLLV
jgi:hypothetical protein